MRYQTRLLSARPLDGLAHRLREAGVDPSGARIIGEKARVVVVRVEGVSAPAANILKQQLISIGGDAAVHRDVIKGEPERSTVFIVCDRRRLDHLSSHLASQPFDLGEIGEEIDRLLARLDDPPALLPLPSGGLRFDRAPLVMGILNVTPDSFSDGGRHLDPEAAVFRAVEMVDAGADIIDVGGESSRPGATPVSLDEERRRVMPVIEGLTGRIDAPISIDTRRAAIAREAAGLGAAIVNDISGMTHDPDMADVVRDTGCAAVIMHMQGTPETMQRDPRYVDPVGEIAAWLDERALALRNAGVQQEKIIVDPGIGFGKRLADNLAILREIAAFHGLGYPVLVGFSRKSFIGSLTGRDSDNRLAGGLAAFEACVSGGVQIVRVHDVPETIDFLRVRLAIGGEEAVR